MVKPEQSNPVSGLAPPTAYGVPIAEYAAASAAWTFAFGAGGGGMLDPPLGVDRLSCCCCWAASAAAAAASASWYLRSSSA